MKSSPLISASELANKIDDSDLKIIFAGSDEMAKQYFLKQHLKGAQYLDLSEDLSAPSPSPSIGGRHPLPELNNFITLLSELGIRPNNQIVVYDDKFGANAAARLWWMLKAADFLHVKVLDGGCPFKYNQSLFAKETGFHTTQYIDHENSTIKTWQLPLIRINEVKDLSEKKIGLIIDVREPLRFNGEREPIDPVAGHIPNAMNLPYTENIDDTGFFKTPKILRKQFEGITREIPPEQIVIHCGSGVTACHTILAMAYADLEIPSLYVGSWSEWCRTENKIEHTG